ncbi:MAG: hydroxyacid dehydrogenase [Rhodospirillales bacterium 69-11]|nr:D-2-hydroxyacid dehydrogenase family protein [Rhodospirillales bacterium]MBN8928680.1 D-2-hydroxyacid dehydrogenase family protein [Rhodospirillales bacterium]OJW31348.1 MAG: hydroxyacid dehydrogenase [Rhodospirillales bacterium 69-11]
MPKVAVLDDWQDVARSSADWAPLEARAEVVFFSDAFANEDEAAAKLADFDIVLSMRERTPLPGSLIRRLPKLRMLGMTGARNLSLDTPACTERGVVVCSTQGGSYTDSATAELALGLLLASARGIPAADASVHSGGFQRGVPVGFALAGKTMGVMGLGKLGAYMASYCLALRMNVLAWSQNLTDARAAEVGVTKVSKEELFERSDAISIHLVLSDRSRGLVGAADIARMKRGAILINTSRGPIVDEAAMVAALQEGRIAAALDVFDREPLPADHPLRRTPNTVLTPHLGYGVRETWATFYPQSVENALAFLDGKPMRVTNPEALGKAS